MNTRYTCIVPVWHEATTAPALIRQIRALDGGGDCEVIVVDGDPEGPTLRCIDDAGSVKLTAPRGRALQMNAGAAIASGEILVFLHADTRLPDSFFCDMDHVIETGAVAGAFRLRFDSPRAIYRIMSWFVTARSRLTREPYGDQAVFMRREYFHRLGGYAPIPIMEDVELVRRIRRSGGRLAMARSSVITSSRRMEARGAMRQVLRNAVITLLYNIGVSPRVLSRWYTDCHRIPDPAATRPGEEDDTSTVVLAGPPDST
jgi:rSAM/selenodomain-associated transferase 2